MKFLSPQHFYLVLKMNASLRIWALSLSQPQKLALEVGIVKPYKDYFGHNIPLPLYLHLDYVQ
jgi:hypothetical protein